MGSPIFWHPSLLVSKPRSQKASAQNWILSPFFFLRLHLSMWMHQFMSQLRIPSTVNTTSRDQLSLVSMNRCVLWRLPVSICVWDKRGWSHAAVLLPFNPLHLQRVEKMAMFFGVVAHADARQSRLSQDGMSEWLPLHRCFLWFNQGANFNRGKNFHTLTHTCTPQVHWNEHDPNPPPSC